MSDESQIAPAAAAPALRALDYPFGPALSAGDTLEVAPGVHWLRMPLPFLLNHINLYAIRDGAGWAVVDTGVQNVESAGHWQRHTAPDGVLADGVTRVMITHMHPDHVGMAGWLTQTYGARLWMTREEYLMCRVLVSDTGREAPSDAERFYRRAGWSDVAIGAYRVRFGGFGKFIHPLPDSYRRLQDGQSLLIGDHVWRVVTGSGHSPEHACLYCESLGVFVSGDQVLPRISSNVSVFPIEPDADPLGDWMASLAKLKREVPDDVLVLPSHNEPFRGLHARLDHLHHSQMAALERLRGQLTTPQRATDVFSVLFSRPIGTEPGLLGMATGESVAHLNYLLHRGEAACELDVDGVAWYRAV